ncbi:hypothetical protein [Vibrio fluvialis]|uniref:hypothetical protein n=1 Tax=Vibrio fluvialis TaxID=676 RepID=UPI001F347F38|nr:hypothetical protein [Vibrio fluvialis]MCE7641776.1 hypothetical protein [Vibrio fluvialis]
MIYKGTSLIGVSGFGADFWIRTAARLSGLDLLPVSNILRFLNLSSIDGYPGYLSVVVWRIFMTQSLLFQTREKIKTNNIHAAPGSMFWLQMRNEDLRRRNSSDEFGRKM